MPRRDEYDDPNDPYRDRYEERPRPRREDRDYDDEDPGYDDYDRPPRRNRRDSALDRVSLPAIFLMIAGGLGFGLAAANGAMILAGFDDGNPFVANNAARKNDPAYKAGQAIGAVLSLAWGPIVFFGGLQMKNLQSRGFVTFACIWAMLPCNACCVLGVPFGIWALVALSDESVKRAF